MKEPQRRGSRRGWVLLSVFVILAAAAGGFYWYQSKAARADPTTVALPAPQTDDTTLKAYFAGPGVPLRALLDKTTTVPAAPSTADCARLGADLDVIGTPSALLQAVAGVPDVGIRDAAANHLDSVTRYLNACGASRDMTSDARDVSYSATVLGRLLARAGAR